MDELDALKKMRSDLPRPDPASKERLWLRLQEETNSSRSGLSRTLRGFLAGFIMLGVLALSPVGPAVADRVSELLGGDDLVVVESDTGFDSFEILEPMTQEALATIPRGAAMAAGFHAISGTVQRNLMNGLPPFGHAKTKFQPDPAFVSAIGRGETNTGSPVTLLVEGDEVCSYSGEYGFGRGNCGDPEVIADRGAVSWGSRTGKLLDLAGLYNDDVAAIDVLGDGLPPIEIPNNALELRDLPYRDITLIGLDDEGNELFRDEVPMGMRP